MSNNQPDLTKSKIEIQPSNPKFWEKEEQDSLLSLFKLLIEIDFKKNPENYKLKHNKSNSKSYESNPNIRNTSNTDQA